MTRLQRQKRNRTRPDRSHIVRRQQRFQRRRTHTELKRIALDIHRGDVWTDQAIPADLLGNCFMVLSFMDERVKREVRETLGKRGMLYEYASKAMPRGINGYPMFFSCRVLSSGEATVVVEILRDLDKSEREVLA